ncbi:DNA cross-link repair protein PSO2/SNM1 [Blastocladiella emersonii ATCC 22665]|nr:DNA cross-link repair protein PSO2/SNM1 [Blastocladiella emersonii ATCC 22665]
MKPNAKAKPKARRAAPVDEDGDYVDDAADGDYTPSSSSSSARSTKRQRTSGGPKSAKASKSAEPSPTATPKNSLHRYFQTAPAGAPVVMPPPPPAPKQAQPVAAVPAAAADDDYDADLAQLLQEHECPICLQTVRTITQDDFEQHVELCLTTAGLVGDPTASVDPASPPSPPSATGEFADFVPVEQWTDAAAAEVVDVDEDDDAVFAQLALEFNARADDDEDGSDGDDDEFLESLADGVGDEDSHDSQPAAPPSTTLVSMIGGAAQHVSSLVTSATAAVARTVTQVAAVVTTTKKGRAKKQRACPFYKWIPDTTFTVDAFCYGAVPGCTAYFLTHFHSDHYGGLSGTFTHGPIFMSPITHRLVRLQFPRVRVDLLHSIPLHTLTLVEDVEVTCFDANQLRAVLFLFRTTSGTCHLHVGDFRAHPSMLEHAALQAPIDSLFLDTTYLKPCHVFPPQRDVLDLIGELTRRIARNTPLVLGRRPGRKYLPPLKYRHYNRTSSAPLPRSSNTSDGGYDSFLPPDFVMSTHTHMDLLFKTRVTRLLVLVGTYTIGKERVFLAVCRALDCKFYCDAKKWKIYSTYDDAEMQERYTADPWAAQVHVVPLGSVNAQSLGAYLATYATRFSHLVAIKPTGWTFTDPKVAGAGAGKQQPSPSGASGSAATPAPRQRAITDFFGGGSKASSSSAGAVEATPAPRQRPITHWFGGGDKDTSASASSAPSTQQLLRPQIPQRRAIYLSDVTPAWVGPSVAMFGISYSEHSSFRELRHFVRGLRVQRIVPTVNVGSAESRAIMDKHLNQWQADKEQQGGAPFPWGA